MLDVSFAELLLIGVVAMIVIGPEELPKAIKAAVRGLRQGRQMLGDVRRSVDEMIETAGVEDIRKEVHQMVDMNGDLREVYDISDFLEPREETEKRVVAAVDAPRHG